MAIEKRSPSWFTTRTTGSMKVGALNSGEDSRFGMSAAADAEKPAKRSLLGRILSGLGGRGKG